MSDEGDEGQIFQERSLMENLRSEEVRVTVLRLKCRRNDVWNVI